MLTSRELFEKVDKLRREKGITQNKLSELAGISHGTLYSWKSRGTMPKIDVIEGICDALGISPISLLYGMDFDMLSEDEVELVVCWRALSIEQKRVFLELFKVIK